MPKKKIIIKERDMKIFYPEWKEDLPFPELLSYRNLVVKPEKLSDINEVEGIKLNIGLNAAGNVISSVYPGKSIGTPPKAGLYVGDDAMGYYSKADEEWKVFIQGEGKFLFKIGENQWIDGGITEEGVVTVRGKLNADDIVAGILTGRTIRTADPNLPGADAVVMAASGIYQNQLLFYCGGELSGVISAAGRILTISNPNPLSPASILIYAGGALLTMGAAGFGFNKITGSSENIVMASGKTVDGVDISYFYDQMEAFVIAVDATIDDIYEELNTIIDTVNWIIDNCC